MFEARKYSYVAPVRASIQQPGVNKSKRARARVLKCGRAADVTRAARGICYASAGGGSRSRRSSAVVTCPRPPFVPRSSLASGTWTRRHVSPSDLPVQRLATDANRRATNRPRPGALRTRSRYVDSGAAPRIRDTYIRALLLLIISDR